MADDSGDPGQYSEEVIEYNIRLCVRVITLARVTAVASTHKGTSKAFGVLRSRADKQLTLHAGTGNIRLLLFKSTSFISSRRRLPCGDPVNEIRRVSTYKTQYLLTSA
ncbi:predicted protein [Histoplasma capsulatum var. duboisii H88]|uniref:Predicted protein n=2 Tax=Ajellomyces capsulatus TaxID=5037 RepID=F0UUD5_AJEC8|nr:predicted protein [Histoplasma capsulatum H143]EGC49512.1 predicted protein [Histoplasma capsulatum var. duboisii H88]